MSATFNLTPSIVLNCRRCYTCNRWFATEQAVEWSCGSCANDKWALSDSQVEQLKRSNASLRGALKRRARRQK